MSFLSRIGDAIREFDAGRIVLAVRRDTAAITAGVADGDVGPVSIDATGNLRVVSAVATGAADLGKAEDAAHASGDVGVMALAVRRDAAASGAGTDGDYASVNVDSAGHVWVRIGSVSAGIATDDAAFGVASGTGHPMFALADETSPDSVDEGDAGILRMTLTRALHINPRNASGTEIGTASAPVRTDPVGTTTQPVSVSAPGTQYNNQQNVTTAGTRVQLTAQALTDGTWVKAKTTNTGLIYVGDSTVSSSNGYPLSAGQEVFVRTSNRNTIWIDAATNGEGVGYIGW